MLASGLDKFDNGFDRLATGLDRFSKGFDRLASGFLSIFKTGLVRFLIGLLDEKPVIPEALELVFSPKTGMELEIKKIKGKTNKRVAVIVNQPEISGDLT